MGGLKSFVKLAARTMPNQPTRGCGKVYIVKFYKVKQRARPLVKIIMVACV
jgi:hypothetical protein